MKFHMPENNGAKKAIWKAQLRRVNGAMVHVIEEKAKILIDVSRIETRQALGEELIGERNALKKRELENRMQVLCLESQKEKLEKAIRS